MLRIGIDIGSTATKVAVLDGEAIVDLHVTPTGFSSVETASAVRERLVEQGFLPIDAVEAPTIVATGYGRVSVPYADRTVTEITCHGRGATYLFGPDGCVLDIGGQDTKVIQLVGGRVKKFVMNDKCSAGTGKFLEVMANRMGVTQQRLAEIAATGRPTPISSMCTVFAESEVVSLIGRGEPLANIANGVYESVVAKVATLANQIPADEYYLTGGLCDNGYMVKRLAEKLRRPVSSHAEARFAGAIGAALMG